MLKKILMLTTIGMALLSNSFVGALDCASCCQICQKGVYVGIQGGYGVTTWDLEEAVMYELGYSSKVDIDNGGWAGRALLGVDLTSVISLEFGYTFLPSQISYKFQSLDHPTFSGKVGLNAYDAVIKAGIPLMPCLRGYGKIGYTYLKARDSFETVVPSSKKNPSKSSFTFGGGFSYKLTTRLSASVDYQYFRGDSNVLRKDYIGDINLFSLGVSYKFPLRN